LSLVTAFGAAYLWFDEVISLWRSLPAV